MIDAISLETAHLLGDALPSAHRLRHRIFVRRRKYAVSSHRGMEWDQFDTPASVDMLWRDEAARVRAVARLIPTSQPYMIQQLWPDLVDGEMPMRDDVWEVTRFGIDPDLDGGRRARIFGEMFCAFAEFGLKTGISAYIFVTPTAPSAIPASMFGDSARRGGWAGCPSSRRVHLCPMPLCIGFVGITGFPDRCCALPARRQRARHSGQPGVRLRKRELDH